MAIDEKLSEIEEKVNDWSLSNLRLYVVDDNGTPVSEYGLTDELISYIQTLVVNLTGNQSIAGVKTFSELPLAPLSVPTLDNQLATRKFVIDSVVGLFDDRGNYDASVNLFPSTGGSGVAGAVLKGDIWTVSVSGTLGGTSVVPGQTVRALVDTPGQTSGNWAISAEAISGIDRVLSVGEALTTGRNIDIGGNAFNISGTSGSTSKSLSFGLTGITQTHQTTDHNATIVTNANGVLLSVLNDLLNSMSFSIDKSVGFIITDEKFSKGLTEAADYSANKTDYSYVTKKMLDESGGVQGIDDVLAQEEALTTTRRVDISGNNFIIEGTSGTISRQLQFGILGITQNYTSTGHVVNSFTNDNGILLEVVDGSSNAMQIKIHKNDGLIVADSKFEKGLTEFADYSANKTDYSYVTKKMLDEAAISVFNDRGNYDASVNLFPSSGGSGVAGAILKGDMWTISVAGTLGGTAVLPGQTIRALIDTPGQTSTNWAISVVVVAGIDDVLNVDQALTDDREIDAGTNALTLKRNTGTRVDAFRLGNLIEPNAWMYSIDGSEQSIVAVETTKARISVINGDGFVMDITLDRTSGMTVSDTIGAKGLEEAADYSANKTDYSYITKKMVADGYVPLTGDKTIAGVKTFSSFPVTPSAAPTTDYQVANVKYVKDNRIKNPYANSTKSGNHHDTDIQTLEDGFTYIVKNDDIVITGNTISDIDTNTFTITLKGSDYIPANWYFSVLIDGTDAVVSRHIDFNDIDGSFFNKFGGTGSTDGLLNSPRDLVFVKNRIYVVDNTNSRVQIFDLNGNYISQFGSSGSTNGLFNDPIGICSDGTKIYISDTGNDRIQVFNLNGVFDFTFGSIGTGNGFFDYPLGVCINNNRLYVVDSANSRVQIFDLDGNYISQFGSLGSTNGLFDNPSMMAVNSPNIYVVDRGNNRVQIFDLDGNYISQFDGSGSDGGTLNGPRGIAVNENNIYVGDDSNKQIQKFDLRGNYICHFGGNGTNDGQFSNIYGVELFNKSLYVSDYTTDYISKFI